MTPSELERLAHRVLRAVERYRLRHKYRDLKTISMWIELATPGAVLSALAVAKRVRAIKRKESKVKPGRQAPPTMR